MTSGRRRAAPTPRRADGGANRDDRPAHVCPFCHGTYWKGDERCPECGQSLRWSARDWGNVVVMLLKWGGVGLVAYLVLEALFDLGLPGAVLVIGGVVGLLAYLDRMEGR